MQSAVMAAAKHGAKQVCSDCASKYYDLGKQDAVCPKCGGKRLADALPRSGRAATSRRSALRR